MFIFFFSSTSFSHLSPNMYISLSSSSFELSTLGIIRSENSKSRIITLMGSSRNTYLNAHSHFNITFNCCCCCWCSFALLFVLSTFFLISHGFVYIFPPFVKKLFRLHSQTSAFSPLISTRFLRDLKMSVFHPYIFMCAFCSQDALTKNRLEKFLSSILSLYLPMMQLIERKIQKKGWFLFSILKQKRKREKRKWEIEENG